MAQEKRAEMSEEKHHISKVTLIFIALGREGKSIKEKKQSRRIMRKHLKRVVNYT